MSNKNMGFLVGAGLVAAAITALVLVLVNGNWRTAQAQTTPSRDNVTVVGEGVYIVSPDIVKLNIGVDVKAPTVTEAQKQATDKMKAITDAVKGQGVKDTDVVTAYYNLNPDYIYNQGKSPVLDGYRVNTALAVTIRDKSKAGAVIDAAGSAGATLFSNIQFTVSNSAEAQKQARQLAIADARTKAEQLAAAGGVKLGNIITVIEEAPGFNSPVPQAKTGLGGGASAPAQSTVIESGEFRIVIQVQVVYGLA